MTTTAPERIRAALAERGISGPRAIQRALGIGFGTAKRIADGQGPLRSETIERAAEVLEMSAAALAYGSEPAAADATPPQPPPAVQAAPPDRLVPSPLNPEARSRVDGDMDLEALADSIRAVGLVQPIGVAPEPLPDGRLQVIFGHRRLAAIRLLVEDGDWPADKGVPYVVSAATDEVGRLLAMLAENRHRKDFAPLEAARLYRRLRDDHGIPTAMIAERSGDSQRLVQDYIRLSTALCPEAQAALEDGRLGFAHAREIAALPGGTVQTRLLDLYLADTPGLRTSADLQAAVQRWRDGLPLDPAEADDLADTDGDGEDPAGDAEPPSLLQAMGDTTPPAPPPPGPAGLGAAPSGAAAVDTPPVAEAGPSLPLREAPPAPAAPSLRGPAGFAPAPGADTLPAGTPQRRESAPPAIQAFGWAAESTAEAETPPAPAPAEPPALDGLRDWLVDRPALALLLLLSAMLAPQDGVRVLPGSIATGTSHLGRAMARDAATVARLKARVGSRFGPVIDAATPGERLSYVRRIVDPTDSAAKGGTAALGTIVGDLAAVVAARLGPEGDDDTRSWLAALAGIDPAELAPIDAGEDHHGGD